MAKEKKRDFLIVVDMQNDFVTGTLGSKDAASVVPRVVERIRTFDGELLFTLDTHDENYSKTQEGRLLPVPHCVKGTDGWELAPEIDALRAERDALLFEKPTFGSTALANYLQSENDREEIDSITLIGLCTDICVVSNALMLKAILPETEIRVDATCCAGTTHERHNAALAVMESCHIIIEEYHESA